MVAADSHRPVRELAELRNEFGWVRVSLDERGNGPRLMLEDVETGATILMSPLELASLCLATDDDRLDWLRVGHYRDERHPSTVLDGGHATPGDERRP